MSIADIKNTTDKITDDLQKVFDKVFSSKPTYPIVTTHENELYKDTIIQHKPDKEGVVKCEITREYKMPLEQIEIKGTIEF